MTTIRDNSHLRHTLILQPSHSTSMSLRLWLHTFRLPRVLACRNSQRAWRSLQPAPRNIPHIYHSPPAAHDSSSASHTEIPKDEEHVSGAGYFPFHVVAWARSV